MDGDGEPSAAAAAAAAPITVADLATIFNARAVSAKVPKFLSYDVDLWYQQTEASFTTANVTVEKTKYYHVLQSLEPEVLRKVSHYARAPTANNEFTGLVAALRAAFSKSDAERWDAIVRSTLGDAKPSELFNQMERLWLDPDPRASRTLRHLFLQRLPPSVAVILSNVDATDMKVFLGTADALVAQHLHLQRPAAVSAVIPSTGDMDLEDVSHAVDQAGHSAGVIPRRGTPSSGRRRDNRSSRDRSPARYCYFHARFGSKANNCKLPCSHPAAGKTKAVNVIRPCPEATPGDGLQLPADWLGRRRHAVILPTRIDVMLWRGC